jgi:hypothetical protein
MFPSAAHFMLLIVSPVAVFGYFYLRRWEGEPGSPYAIAIRRFRQAMLIAGLGGLFGLLRLWLMSQK